MLPSRSRSENAMAASPITPVNTSLFDLSNFHKTSFSMGELIPFYNAECLPGDYWSLSVEGLYRQPRLLAPIMESLEIHHAFFFVRYSAIYDKWKSVIKPNWSDLPEEKVPVINFKFEYIDGIPGYDMHSVWMSHITQYMGFPVPTNASDFPGADTEYTVTINALPIVAYYKIWNDYYRDSIIQPEFGYNEQVDILSEEPIIRNLTDNDYTSLWESQYDAWVFEMGYNDDDTTVQYRQARMYVFYRNYNPDYFTAATYEPQYGENVVIPVVSKDASIFGGAIAVSGPRQFKDATTDAVINAGQVTTNASGMQVGGTDAYLDTQGVAGTIAELRFAESMQRFLERINRTGDRYRNHIREFYGTDPGDTGDYAVYIGSYTGIMSISDVWQTSQASAPNETEVGAGVGSYAGRSIGNLQTPQFTFRCPDFGHLIGIVNVQPQSSYHQGVERMWTRETWEDYALDAFAHIGDQEILERELLQRYDLAWTHQNQVDTWGYVPRFSEWRYKNSITSGELRKFLTQFHLTRDFARTGSTPFLNGAFLQASSQNIDSSRVMYTTDINDDVYAWIWTQAKVIRALPKFGIPMLP